MSDDCIGCLPPDTDGFTIDPVFHEGQNSGVPAKTSEIGGGDGGGGGIEAYQMVYSDQDNDWPRTSGSLDETWPYAFIVLVFLMVLIKLMQLPFKNKEPEPEPAPGIIELVEDLNNMAYQMMKTSFPLMRANIETKRRWKDWIYRGDVPYYTMVGQRIKREREKQGITQEELAKTMRTSRGVIAGIENGKQRMYAHQMIAVCNELSIHPITLLSI